MIEDWRLLARWSRLRRHVTRRARAFSQQWPAGPPPLRAELLSAEQLEAHGRTLSKQHRLLPEAGPELLLDRLRENQAILDDASERLTAMVRDGLQISPAGEWLLDNYYLIEDQVRLARRHLPRDYSRDLPLLAEGASAGLPRVYDLAMQAIAHGDGGVDAETLSRLVSAYQEAVPLKLGELWAVPIMLRLAVIENLRRIAVRIIRDAADHRQATEWSRRMVQAAESAPKDVVLVLADMARAGPPASSAFVSELVRRLQGRGAALTMPLEWVGQWLADAGRNTEAMVHGEGRKQAADQVSIRNSIASLRFLSAMDWREYVETMSVVEQILRRDPDGTYARMDFTTRDHYRHRVERIARRAGVEEHLVASAALSLAQAASGTSAAAPPGDASADDALPDRAANDGSAHVGYWLVGDGVDALYDAVGALPGAERPHPWWPRRVPLGLYLAPAVLISAGFTAWLLHGTAWPAAPWLRIVVALLALLAASEMAIALVNWTATLLVSPKPLPRLDFSGGIPADARTVVVVPTMLGSLPGIDALAEGLEVRYLANRDPQLRYVLLTDFLDAESETLPNDASLVAHASAHIAGLNARYRGEDAPGDRFFLLHRARLWNPRERAWMGYERKRGKLSALSTLLRTGDAAAFSHVAGDLAELQQARYVITLDTDTLLPRGAASELVGAMAHPLNRPAFDPDTGRVVRGYGILQPGVGSTMSGRRGSRFARLFGTETGIDPYTRTVSDVYQDVFGEGSFVGKGIFGIEAFEQAIGGRFPDDAILSHDLIEGCYARAGLISDVRLYEDYPARYLVDMRRRARWVRGDWQLLPWLLPRVPLPDGTRERNPLSWLSRGKLVDNLRRSLVAPAALALFVAGWWWLADPLRWTLGLLALWALPVVLPAVREVFARPVDMAPEPHLLHVAQGLGRALQRAAVALACLPYESGVHLSAIGRTLWRLAVSRRHLLQWNPSHEVERRLARRGSEEIREMLPASLAAAGFGIALGVHDARALLVAAPLLALWIAAPPWMAWLGRPRAESRDGIDASDSAWLGVLARRTWAFFETWMGEDDHWLPPDNIQELDGDVVARRTSPTNIGLALLANLAAWDFGYLQAGGVIARTRATLATLARLERYRGHFYNWYDTATLEPLPPRYVSTVDSGNLAGHLIALRQGLLALADAPVVAPHTADGLEDTLAAAEAGAGDAAKGAALSGPIERVRQGIAQLRASPGAPLDALLSLQADAVQLVAAWANAGLDPAAPCAPAALQRACDEALEEWGAFAPQAPPADADATRAAPTLRMLADSDDARVSDAARARIAELEDLATQAGAFADMDVGFLYDRAQQLLSIGFNVDERRLDAARYDLLASEARLGHFVAIAQGRLPQDSWFALGRLLTEVDGEATLLSWSGSMFEYLMPHLVMPAYPDTLLEQTMRHSVQAQIHYGRLREVPWGISESGYAAVDAQRNWQYRAFGVPGLGLKRGLGDDLVIAPYASAMALLAAPVAATRNLRRLQAAGFGGRFGLYEAIDYTPERQPPGHEHTLIRQWMAHHQGMAFLAMVSLLRGEPMQRRFVADPSVQATLLLLQERIPRIGTFHPHEADFTGTPAQFAADEAPRLRVFNDPGPARPAVQLLSNGRYHVMVTAAGGGYSRRGEIAVTRWRDDATRDAWGQFCYLRDLDSGEVWSTAHQPACVPVRRFEAIFSDAKAEFRGRHRDFDHHLAIAVSSEDDIELRRLTLTNRARRTRTIEFTTYAEVVLSAQAADEAHPAFGNLFVRTAILRDRQAITCSRRPRAPGENPPGLLHLVAVHDADIDAISYETDRARFIGRTRSLRDPAAMDGERLTDTEGAVLDPIVAIRCRITLAPDQVASIDIVTGVCSDDTHCGALIEKYRDRRLADRVFDLAWTHSQVSNRQINATAADTRLYERIAGLVMQGSRLLRADASIVRQNRRGQSGLWGQAISGDLPIVLVQVTDEDQLPLVRQMVQAHAYLRLRGLATDLVVWNDSQTGYRQQLHEQILGLLSRDPASTQLDAPGGIFVRTAQQMSQEERVLLQSVARVIVHGEEGTLAEQLARTLPPDRDPPARVAGKTDASVHAIAVVDAPEPGLPPSADPDDDLWPFEPPAAALGFDNGIGGFSRDGREYVIVSRPSSPTPAPWSNVLANAVFGCVVSESAAGYSWHGNAHAFRLTPWHNDPVSDTCGEAYYLRDEATGAVWSPMPLPCRGAGAYRTRHGFGYTVYEHVEDGIASELWVFVDPVEPVKYAVLKLRNLSGRARALSATGYVEWVLGDLPSKTRMHVVTGIDLATGVLTARNPYNGDFGARCAFFDVDAARDPEDGSLRREATADRVEFLGRNGHASDPAALHRRGFSGRTGVGLDPCAALQVPVALAVDGTFETTFRLGSAQDEPTAIALAARLRAAGTAHDALDVVRVYWRDVLGRVAVETPDPAVDVLANGWLMYQVLASRCFGRSGYYQSGGAFGFRDQLQDTMASIHALPALSRTHLLASAAQQFPEGDVLHWWHPPSNRGVRTRCSDDYLWLPQAAARYVEVTGDRAVLREQVAFVEGRPVRPDEESYYDLPTVSGHRDTLYAHCRLALERGARLLGERGLPLIGTGDWNDGMNKVGEHGRGESVWLAFFLIDALQRFAPVARGEGDAAFADWCGESAAALRSAVELHAWDGAWYRRAWFDDGTPLGSQANEECSIDSISQSWAVLSGAGSPERVRTAMASLDSHLVRPDAGLIQLLDPPFDRIEKDPGYIRGYVPGVRENGGQYTHAAVWAVMAHARMGNAQRAWELAAMINPVAHARDVDAVERYRVEPYVMAADVYGVAPHDGRGGWTWYTGSAGWMYRLLLESLLGFERRGDRLHLAPCVPRAWDGYRIDYRLGRTAYRIAVRQHDGGEVRLSVDGVVQPAASFALVDDGAVHEVALDWPRAVAAGAGDGDGAT